MRRLNISIDDVSPHPLSGIDVVDSCFKVLDRFGDVKFTLFVPTAYWRTIVTPGRPDTTTKNALHLREHRQFCDRLASLPRSNFEVGFHGRFHGIPGVSNNDEFRSIGRKHCAGLWKSMQHDVESAGLSDVFVPVIRPPAMYMSPDAIRFFTEHDVLLALSPRSIHMRSYGDAVDDCRHNIVFANMWLPDDSLDNAHRDVDIELLYHACTWDGGYFDDAKVDSLLCWLERNTFEFSFIADLNRG